MIPKGKVASYGQIAELAGLPGYARHVGHALSEGLKGPNGSAVPAHRVVNSQGVLSGADSFETRDTQEDRLKKEGVVFSNYRKVKMKESQWQPTWDEMIYIEEMFGEMRLE